VTEMKNTTIFHLLFYSNERLLSLDALWVLASIYEMRET
jgi:hypothetical protein